MKECGPDPCMLQGKWSFAKKALATAVFSLAFEIIQYIFTMGRADVTDVLSNTLGGVVGIGVYLVLLRGLKGKTNTFLAVIAAVLTTFILLFIALLLANHRWVIIK